MAINLVRVGIEDAENLWKMQVRSFAALYEKYQDTSTSPATEKLEKTITRLQQPSTYFYYIQDDGVTVGAIRVVDARSDDIPKRVSPIFILPEYRNRKYAQTAMMKAEEIHGCHNWELDTILQEKGNCYLYEKMGYSQTGKTEVVNERLTLVFYKKD